MTFLLAALRRIATVLALAVAALVAASFAVLVVAAAGSIAVALWLSGRFGRRVPTSPAGRDDRDAGVIDVDMPEVEPGRTAPRGDASVAQRRDTGGQ